MLAFAHATITVARGRVRARQPASRSSPQAKRSSGSAAPRDPQRRRPRGQVAIRTEPPSGPGRVAPATTLAPRIARCPRMGTARAWRSAAAALLAVSFFPAVRA
jgi:hypothetical protein